MSRSLNVLIAEDEPLASMALRAQIEALGHSVLAVARDGEEALALGQCVPAELAVLDQRMPGMTGLDAAVRLFPIAPVPVLLLTGYSASQLPDPIPVPPIFGTVEKPVGLDGLRGGIDGAINAFDAWVDAEQRHDLVRGSLHDRAAIRDEVSAAADTTGRPLSRIAIEVTRQAAADGRSPAQIAADIARRNGP